MKARNITIIERLGRYGHRQSYLNARVAIFLIIASLCTGMAGFMYLENYSVVDAFYMTVITISTVGFTEAQPLSDAGKIFSSIFILFNVGIFAYGLSVFTSYIIEGQLFRNMQTNLIRKDIEEMEQHVIVCGYGKHGQEIAQNFKQHRVPFVIIENNEDQIEEIKAYDNQMPYLVGDATHDEVLLEAGIKRARGLISSLGEDADNVFTVLTARQLNPTLNIISRARFSKTKRKLELAGANHVIQPEQIGGFYMASLISRPGAIEFFSFLANQEISAMTLRALSYDQFPKQYRDKTITELGFRTATGANVIGYRQSDGSYVVNPSPHFKVCEGCTFIVLGNEEQLKKVDDFMKGRFAK